MNQQKESQFLILRNQHSSTIERQSGQFGSFQHAILCTLKHVKSVVAEAAAAGPPPKIVQSVAAKEGAARGAEVHTRK